VAALNILASSNVLHLQLANEPSQVSQAAVVRLTQQVKETQQRLLAAQRRLQHVSADESMPRASHQGASGAADTRLFMPPCKVTSRSAQVRPQASTWKCSATCRRTCLTRRQL